MSKTTLIEVQKLSLDLKNLRTVEQSSETKAIHSIITLSPAKFHGLINSIIADGYIPTENIVVLKDQTNPPTLIVKEGNRRIAAMKLIHGHVPLNKFDIPDDIKEKIRNVTPEWKTTNTTVPCIVFEFNESKMADRVVSLTHGKAEGAGRDTWEAVARARHNREMNSASEPGLDLLEIVLKSSKEISQIQAERWAGRYYITVLDEALKKLAKRLEYPSAKELVAGYKKGPYKEMLTRLVIETGLENLSFQKVRDTANDFAVALGFPAIQPLTPAPTESKSTEAEANPLNPENKKTGSSAKTTPTEHQNGKPETTPPTQKSKQTKAIPIDDPRTITRFFKNDFRPKGNNRNKLESLRQEVLNLTIEKNPIAFCFLLRSIIEISAKLYCDDHQSTGGPKYLKPDQNDRKLVEVLREIIAHMLGEPKNKTLEKRLHGAITELAKSDGLLSVTSLNQLVHNTRFSIPIQDICGIFGNISPLIEDLNK